MFRLTRVDCIITITIIIVIIIILIIIISLPCTGDGIGISTVRPFCESLHGGISAETSTE
jgi:hypothetical protein